MSREIQINVWCDYCMVSGEHVEATEINGINTVGVKVIVDLCDDHIKEFLEPALNIFDAHGRTDTKAARAHRRLSTPAIGPCPECGTEFATSQSLGMHRWRKHGVPSQHRRK